MKHLFLQCIHLVDQMIQMNGVIFSKQTWVTTRSMVGGCGHNIFWEFVDNDNQSKFGNLQKMGLYYFVLAPSCNMLIGYWLLRLLMVTIENLPSLAQPRVISNQHDFCRAPKQETTVAPLISNDTKPLRHFFKYLLLYSTEDRITYRFLKT